MVTDTPEMRRMLMGYSPLTSDDPYGLTLDVSDQLEC